ncbi:glycosyltransferase family A protein [Marinoscillum pacificum]|uniref:glycosyltransferase family A protein n=1 Tax=Marinoscillum pacificum TaxID=392723 RepID=UPI00215776E0|nr:glycosyltransferase family A protein [Marinoscillum pacificum]
MFFRKNYRGNSFTGRSLNDLTLTFCITHKNRESYLKKTLLQNLNDNQANPNVDFVLVDFQDDLEIVDWVSSEFKSFLGSGKLKAFHSNDLPEWHSPKAKNCAHALAEGDILVNLDCDNYTGKNGGDFIIKHFSEATNEILFWQYSKKKLDGSYGRIALTKNTFYELGGYDESFLPMGFQDGDLIKRAERFGTQIIKNQDPLYNMAIKHEKFIPHNMTWKRMNEHNQRISKKNIKEGLLVANSGDFGVIAKNVKRID